MRAVTSHPLFPQLLLLGLVGLAITVILTMAVHVRSDRRRDLLQQVVIIVGAYFVYFLVRGATEGDVAAALRNAEDIERFERGLGIYLEPTLQAAIVGERWLVDALNWVYLWGHWPVIGATAVWLYIKRPEAFRLTRNAFLISGAIGLAFFATLPTAPPRLADIGLVDTVTEHADFYRLLQPRELTNQYAAFPSLHFGWNLLIGIALVREAPRLAFRAFGALSPVAMLAAIVLTANHYFVDAIAGGIVALTGLYLAHMLHRHPMHPMDVTRDATRGLLSTIHAATALVLDPRPRRHVGERRASADAGDGSPAIFFT